MAIRLTVVLSQPTSANRHAQDLADDLVAQLLGRPSIDLALIGPLESVAEAATDRLMLEGLKGDFAILAWSDAEATIERLRELRIEGRRAPHRGDPDVPLQSGRRIYCYDGRGYRSATEVVATLAALLKDRQVVAFPLTVPATPRASAANPSAANASPAGAPRGDALPAGASRASTPPAGGNEPAAEARDPAPRAPAAQPPQDAGASDETLDALVDDLNALDL